MAKQKSISKQIGSFANSIGKANTKLVGSEATAASRRALSEIGTVEKIGGRAIDAVFNTSPGIKKSYDAMMGQLDTLGPNDIESELSNQALTDLKLGGQLSPEDERNASQSARAAFASRGLLYGTPAAAAEVLNRQQFADQRRGERRAFAGGVNDSVNARTAADRSFVGQTYDRTMSTLDPFARVFAGYSTKGGVSALNQPVLDATQMNESRDAFAQKLNFDRQQLAEEVNQAKLTRKNNTLGAVLGGGLGVLGSFIGR